MPQDGWPVPAFHFLVNLPGGDTSFQEVAGLSVKRELEAVIEGGENRFTHRLPKPADHANLVLKRAIAPFDSALVGWCRDVLEGTLARPIEPRSFDVHLLDENGNALRSWAIVNAFPVNWTVEAFNATKNEVAIERIEFAYHYANRTT